MKGTALLLLPLLIVHAAAALSPGLQERCCWGHEEGGPLPEECAEVDLQKCEEVLEEWEQTERAWLRSLRPFFLRPEVWLALILAFIIWLIAKRRTADI